MNLLHRENERQGTTGLPKNGYPEKLVAIDEQNREVKIPTTDFLTQTVFGPLAFKWD